MFFPLSTMALFAFCIFIVAMFKTFTRKAPHRRLPPGPKGWPFVGVLGQIDFQNLADEFLKFRKAYGNIFCFNVLNKTIVVICGAKTTKDVLTKHADAVSDRAHGFAIDNPRGYGLIDSSGENHRAMRNFTLKSFRTFGFENRNLETIVCEEALEFLKKLNGKQGQPFNVNDDLVVCLSNIICSFALGQKMHNRDAELLKAIETNNIVISHPLRFLPIFIPERLLKLVPGDPFGIWLREKSTNHVIKFLRQILEEHKKTYNPNVQRDYIDAYLDMAKEEDCSDIFTDGNLLRSIYDLFFAGTETSVITIKWCILMLLHHPDVQTKMREEIENTIGRRQMPTMDHKPMLPYCEAVILEVQRHRNIAPFSLPRAITYDIDYEGMVIPKGGILFPFILSAAVDEEVFPNPGKFDPTRFLDEEGQVYGQERMIPFAAGRRVCLGEALAKMELFIFIVSLVQNFRLVPEIPDSLPTLDGETGGVFVPKPYQFKAVAVV